MENTFLHWVSISADLPRLPNPIKPSMQASKTSRNGFSLQRVLPRICSSPLSACFFLIHVHAHPFSYFLLWLKKYAARYEQWAAQTRPARSVNSEEQHRFSSQVQHSTSLTLFFLRAKQTFLTPGADYELNISSKILSPFHTDLFVSPHPDPVVFREVAWRVYDMLKESLDRFLLSILYMGVVHARENQSTPLHLASSRANADIVQLLIEIGADVHARDENQSTPLHLASSRENADIVQLLIENENGGDVHARDENQSTPVHLASSRGNADIVQLLIKNGADVNARDESQSTPLHRVLSGKRDTISRLMIDHGANATVQVLIENGADVNARDQSQSTPLHLASSSWDVKITRLLIKHGADVNAQNQDQSTPLHIASSLSFSMNMGTTVRVLIENGARVNAYDKNHQTPLHRVSSCWDPNSDCLRLLLENGADVDVEDNKGLTALQIALSQENQHHRITQLLRDHRDGIISNRM